MVLRTRDTNYRVSDGLISGNPKYCPLPRPFKFILTPQLGRGLCIVFGNGETISTSKLIAIELDHFADCGSTALVFKAVVPACLMMGD